ncbi:MAG: hypothetical protein AB7F40_11465, partial [Victivallaceae bacterium]
MLPPPPSTDPDAFGTSYGCGFNQIQFKRNIALYNRAMLDHFKGVTGVYVLSSNVSLDTINNMQRAMATSVNSRNSTVTVVRQNNGVHPADTGYQQIGDALWAFLKCKADH